MDERNKVCDETVNANNKKFKKLYDNKESLRDGVPYV